MEPKKIHHYTDFIELLVVLAMIFLVIAIYVPVAIWEEESNYENESRFRMESIYNLEAFYSRIADGYSDDGLWAMNVVNAIRDSVMADSSYIGPQTLSLFDREVLVDIPIGFDVDYDTTFGFQKFRRDTTIDTTVAVVIWSEELSRMDTIHLRQKNLAALEREQSFREVISREPFELVEVVSYFDTYMPDSSFFKCPVTNESYNLKLDENGFSVASPIDDIYKENRYLVFAFKAQNHGFIEDGVPSWER